MSLKTSCFSLPLFKANLKRFWWISALYMLAFLSIGMLLLIDNDDADGFQIMNVVTFIMCGFLPAIFFSYLNSVNSVTCLHAFPVRRRAHYITNVVTIYLMVLVPALISYIIGGIYAAVYCPSELHTLKEAFIMLPLCVTISTGGALLGTFVTGNTLAAVIFGWLFIGLPFYGEAVIKAFLSENVYGIMRYDIYTVSHFNLFKINSFMTGLSLTGLLLIFLCWFLYKYRNLEVNGDIISFKFLKPVFIAIVTFFAGILGYFYLSSIFDESIFFLIPFGLLGIVISYMLSKRAFTIKGIQKPVIIYLLAVVAVFFTIKYDLTGFERRIPDAEDVESVYIINKNDYQFRNNNLRYLGNVEFKNPVEISDYYFTGKEDIQNVINLHKELIKRKNEQRYLVQRIPVVYNLKNGRVMKREYYVNNFTDREILRPLYETAQMRKYFHEYLRDDEAKVLSVRVIDQRFTSETENDDNTFRLFDGETPEAKKLLEAIKKDIENSTYEDIVSDSNSMTSIEITFERPVVIKDGENVEIHGENIFNDYFGIPESYKNTTALLREYGLFEKITKPSDIDYLNFVLDNFNNEKIKITDPAAVEEIYDFLSTAHLVQKHFTDGSEYYISIRMHDSKTDKFIERNLYGTFEEYPEVIKSSISECMENIEKEEKDSGGPQGNEKAEVIEINQNPDSF